MFFSLFAQKEEFRNVSLNSAISKQRITRVSCSKISQKRLNFPEVSKNTVFDISRVVHHLEHSNFKLDRFMHIHYMLNSLISLASYRYKLSFVYSSFVNRYLAEVIVVF